MADFTATAIYHNDLGSARTVSTGSMRVLNILITNTTNAIVDYEIQNGAGTQIMKVTLPADSSFTIDADFIVQGMIIAAEADTSFVTVFYRPGA